MKRIFKEFFDFWFYVFFMEPVRSCYDLNILGKVLFIPPFLLVSTLIALVVLAIAIPVIIIRLLFWKIN